MEALFDGTSNHSVSRLPSCEADLRDLLQQIDSMVSHRRQTWERQNQELQVQLRARETELMRAKMQVRYLQQQAEERDRTQRDAASWYQKQLDWLHCELQRLKGSYDKLMHCHEKQDLQREPKTDASSQNLEFSRKLELGRLTLSSVQGEFQKKAPEWEDQKLDQLQVIQRSLAVPCSHLPQVNGANQDQLTSIRHRESLKDEFTEMRARLDKWYAVEMKEDTETMRQKHAVEKQGLQQELEFLRGQYQVQVF